ncbi:hypothetical protein WA1_24005 [Scytonema hofmannii PCC 7110]|uniref:Uncharacterized protein n=1 Tax=Scytonema hofmannii PCC 7110 TaxID=128403 RepID=A0A139X7N2_9CYAN|nr:hypothetical protein [Scytonema hofmannii]KYC40708.1 hypothetical protein WA1_24005 [Scytonema hofmannii PCC 7110]
MTTKNYQKEYRRLKEIYEKILGCKISDITWYRVVSQLKKHFSFEILGKNSETLVKLFANLKKSTRNFRISDNTFNDSWDIFQYYYKQERSITCAEFLEDLSKRLDLKVSKKTIYKWFTKAECPYKADKYYAVKDLALVAFQASKCIQLKQLQKVKSATVEVNAIVLRGA